MGAMFYGPRPSAVQRCCAVESERKNEEKRVRCPSQVWYSREAVGGCEKRNDRLQQRAYGGGNESKAHTAINPPGRGGGEGEERGGEFDEETEGGPVVEVTYERAPRRRTSVCSFPPRRELPGDLRLVPPPAERTMLRC